jgi:peptide/nickel transport system permease protein
MLKLLGRRVLISIPTLLIVSLFVFVLIDLTPGDPAFRLAGESPTPEQVEEVRKRLRLDDPLLVRYSRWLGNFMRGDMGESLVNSEPVADAMRRRVGITLSLAGVTLLLTIVAGTLFGVIAALRVNGPVDRIITTLSSLSIAMPSFWLAMLLVVAFAVHLPWFPAIGYVPLSHGVGPWLYHLVLPAVALASHPTPEMAMQVRGALLETLQRDFVLTAHAKGLPRHVVVLKHALKNAAVPVVTVLGYRAAQLLGGTVIIEVIFALEGVGALAVASATNGDVPMLLGVTMFSTLIVLAMNILVDASYGYFNPKVRT